MNELARTPHQNGENRRMVNYINKYQQLRELLYCAVVEMFQSQTGRVAPVAKFSTASAGGG
jgi:hypothetical protein